MNPSGAAQRIVAGTAATLTATFVDADGESAAPTGTVTVKVTRADGTTLLAAGSSTTAGTEPGVVCRSLTAAQTASLDMLAATWTDGTTGQVVRTFHEIAGGVYFTVAEARAGDGAIAGGFADGAVKAARTQVETEFETITGCAFVPRFRWALLDGNGTRAVSIPDPLPRTVRAVRIFDGAGGSTGWDSTTVAACLLDEAGAIVAPSGAVFDIGRRNVAVGYEHGYDMPPPELRRLAIKRARQVLTESASAIPSRATSFQVGDTGVFRLATAGRYGVGDPDIDGVLARYSWRTPGVA